MNYLLQQHMTPEEMALALAGELPPERQEAFERHRSACQDCAAAFAEQVFARQMLASLGREPAMPERLATKLHAQLMQESQTPPAEEEAASPVLVPFPARPAGLSPALANKRQTQRRFQPPRWVAAHRVAVIALAAILAVGLMAGSVYAVTTLLDQVIGYDPGTKQVDLEHQYIEVNQSQTIGGFTVTLEKAYADANRVIIAGTVKKPSGHIYNHAMLLGAALTTDQGVTLKQIGGDGYGNRNGNDAYVSWFDGAAINGAPKTLSLHLTATGLDVTQQDGDDSTVQNYTVPGSVSFDFSVPFHTGRVANLHQSLTVGGTTITLERVVVTLSETRVYLQAGVPDQQQSQDGKGPVPLITHLSVGGWDSDHSQGAISEWETPDGLTEISYSVSLFDQHGPWTLTVQATDDSWTFHFNVP